MMRSSLVERERPEGLASEAMPSARRCWWRRLDTNAAPPAAAAASRARFLLRLLPLPGRQPPWLNRATAGGVVQRLLDTLCDIRRPEHAAPTFC